MKVIPLFGVGIVGKSDTITRQRRVNVYLENRPDGDKAKTVFLGTPGLTYQWSMPNGRPRGLYGTQQNLFSVAFDTFYDLNYNGSINYSSKIFTIDKLVSMASTGSQTLIVDGVDGYVYSGPNVGLTSINQPSTSTASSITTSVLTTTAQQANGSSATLTFASTANYPGVGSTIVVSGLTPSVYNGTFTVTASSNTYCTYACADGATFLGSIAGTALTVSSVSKGTIVIGQTLQGSGVTAGTTIVSGSGLNWVVSASQTVAIETLTSSVAQTTAGSIYVPIMTIGGTVTGVFTVGQTITGSGVLAGTTIVALGSGTGGVGTYFVNQLQTVSSTIITAAYAGGFPFGARTCTFCSGYFVVEQPFTQKFWVSNSFDASQWDPLAFASASQYPDYIKAVDSLNGNLILFSELHTEFWQNIGTTPVPYAPIIQAATEYGLAAIFSRAHVAGAICFLAQNPQGALQFCQINGYQIRVISNPDVDYLLSQITTVSDAVAMGYQIDNHSMYQISFPTANRTLLYDLTTGVWSEMQTGVSTDGSPKRHMAQLCAQYNGQTYVSDYQNGNIYHWDSTSYTDDGQTILREIITRHISSDFNTFGIDELYFDMETGVGNPGRSGWTADTTIVTADMTQYTADQLGPLADGSNPMIMIGCSKDNGRTWQTDRYMPLGARGQYHKRVIARQWGTARDFVFRLRMTDPVKFILTDGAVTIREKPQ